MSLMKLSPETVRLRRIAKAFAAGEFSEQEYRAVRREVIANYVVSVVDDDDTQPRPVFSQDPSEHQAEAGNAGRGRRLLLVAVLLAGSLIAAAQVLAAQTGYIAPVAERDPNPVTSPRLAVTAVTLEDFAPLPGIREAEVQAVIDARLEALRATQTPGEHGFTQGELEEIGRFLNALGVHDERTRFTQQDLSELRDLVSEQKTRRGLSVIELEEVAEAVQDYYREAGYFLAVAYLPAQHVSDGVVRVGVLPGVLGDVVVDGDAPGVRAGFADLVGEPVTEEVITTRIYALNEAPGLSAQASFEPGTEVGETVLTLAVADDRRWNGSVALDNHGDSGTGERRLLANAALRNPTGRGDSLDIGALTSLEDGGQIFGSVAYETPLDVGYAVRASLGYTDFEVPRNSAAAITGGQGVLADVALSRSLYRDRRRGLAAELGAGYHRLTWDVDGIPGLGDATQDAYFVTGALRADRVWDTSRIAADATVRADLGRIEGDTFDGQDSSFWRLGMDAFAWRPFDLPGLPGLQKLSAEVRGQLSGSELPSTRRMIFGGDLGVRGFQRDAYLADRGMLARLDVRTPGPVGELALFADLAYGDTLNDQDGDWGFMSSYGIAWDLEVNNVYSRLSWAVPVSSDGSGDIDDDGPQFFWSVSYHR